MNIKSARTVIEQKMYPYGNSAATDVQFLCLFFRCGIQLTTPCQQALLKCKRRIFPSRLEIVEPIQTKILQLLSPRLLTTCVIDCSMPVSVATELFLLIHQSNVLKTVGVSKSGLSFLKFLPSLAQRGLYYLFPVETFHPINIFHP